MIKMNETNQKQLNKFYETVKLFNYNNVKVIENKNIIVVGVYHFHFSEYEDVKIIKTDDISYSETLISFESVLKSIQILSNYF